LEVARAEAEKIKKLGASEALAIELVSWTHNNNELRTVN
jgi:hypothetical protein